MQKIATAARGKVQKGVEKAGKRSPRGDGREVEVSSRQILPEPVIMKLNLQHEYQNKERNTMINKTKKTNKNRRVKKRSGWPRNQRRK